MTTLIETLWKDIPDYPVYQAHPEGEIRNKKTKRLFNNESKSHRYKYVMLSKKSLFVHRIIALTFLPNPLNLPEVNHIDGNRRNNKLSNLEWITHSDNVKHAVAMGRKTAKPTRKTSISLTTRDGTTKIYSSLEEAAKALNIKRTTITTCLRGDGVYTGVSGYRDKEKNWKWKVSYVKCDTSTSIDIIKKPIMLDGFTDYIACSDGTITNKEGKQLGTCDGHYYRVRGKCGSSKAIHILIASTFIPKLENKPYVNHIDGNKKNNAVSNLEWVTQKENVAHAIATGLINKETRARQGQKSWIAVYQLELDGTVIKRFESVDAAGKIIGSPSNISSVCSSYLLTKDVERNRYSSSGYGWCHVKDYTTPIINKNFKKVFPELEGRKDIQYDKIRKYVESGSRPIWQIDIDGTRLKLWDSCQEVVTNIPYTSVASLCISINSELTKMFGGYYWQQASYDDIINPSLIYTKSIPIPIKKALGIPADSTLSLRKESIKLLHENTGEDGHLYIKTKPIVQLTLTDEIIRYWSSPEKARHTLHLGRNNIEQVLTGKQKTACGFKWRFMTIDEMCC